MHATARIQSVSGVLAVIVGFPLLYSGIFYQLVPATIAGFVVFAVGLLTTSALQFVPQQRDPAKPDHHTEPQPDPGTDTRTDTATQ